MLLCIVSRLRVRSRARVRFCWETRQAVRCGGGGEHPAEDDRPGPIDQRPGAGQDAGDGRRRVRGRQDRCQEHGADRAELTGGGKATSTDRLHGVRLLCRNHPRTWFRVEVVCLSPSNGRTMTQEASGRNMTEVPVRVAWRFPGPEWSGSHVARARATWVAPRSPSFPESRAARYAPSSGFRVAGRRPGPSWMEVGATRWWTRRKVRSGSRPLSSIVECASAGPALVGSPGRGRQHCAAGADDRFHDALSTYPGRDSGGRAGRPAGASHGHAAEGSHSVRRQALPGPCDRHAARAGV